MKYFYEIKDSSGKVISTVKSTKELTITRRPDIIDLSKLRGQYLKDPHTPSALLGVNEDHASYKEGISLSREYSWSLNYIRDNWYLVPKHK